MKVPLFQAVLDKPHERQDTRFWVKLIKQNVKRPAARRVFFELKYSELIKF